MNSPRLSIILALTFLFSSYLPKDIDITKFEYVRYVKPQLKSIVQDYKTLIIGLTPQLKPISKVFDIQRKLYELEHKLPSSCSATLGKTCIGYFTDISQELLGYHTTISTKVEYSKIKYINSDGIINAQNLLEKSKIQIIKTIESVQNLKLNLQLSETSTISTADLKKNILDSIVSVNQYILSLSDNRFRTQLQGYYSSFVVPVTKYILVRDNKKIFTQNINEFNIRLNALAMRITKFNFPVPKQVKTLINIIHNRWNNILKVSLITNPKK